MRDKLKIFLENTLNEPYESFANVENLKDLEFWDSLVYVNLVVGLQQEFKVNLTKDDIQQLLSVKGIESVLTRYGVQ